MRAGRQLRINHDVNQAATRPGRFVRYHRALRLPWPVCVHTALGAATTQDQRGKWSAMPRYNADLCRRWAADERGAIAVLFALMLMPMLGLVLTAIDYGRAVRHEGQLQQAVDSAAAAAVHKLGQEHGIVEEEARRHLDAALPSDLKGLAFWLEIGPQNKSVEIRVESSVSTSMIGLIGFTKFAVQASSQAFAEQPARRTKSIDVALPPGTDRDAARTLEDLARQAGIRGGAGAGPTAEQKEEYRRASEEADRIIRAALSRIGR